jgi:hypothetical protein
MLPKKNSKHYHGNDSLMRQIIRNGNPAMYLVAVCADDAGYGNSAMETSRYVDLLSMYSYMLTYYDSA